MTVSHSAEDRILGGERRTDGLWRHRGKLNLGGPTTLDNGGSGDLRVNRASGLGTTNGTGAIYFGKGDKYLYFDGTSFVFGGAGTPLSATLAPNTAQQLVGSALINNVPWSSVTTGWQATNITCNATCSGGLVRIECTTSIAHNTVGATVYFGLFVNGMQLGQTLLHAPVAGYSVPVTAIHYWQSGAATYTFALYVYNPSGTVTVGSTVISTLWVTEQKA